MSRYIYIYIDVRSTAADPEGSDPDLLHWCIDVLVYRYMGLKVCWCCMKLFTRWFLPKSYTVLGDVGSWIEAKMDRRKIVYHAGTWLKEESHPMLQVLHVSVHFAWEPVELVFFLPDTCSSIFPCVLFNTV